ncbi:MAG: DUF4358 domain-containing protein [Eubacterium sp.]|nr:DUF4358 domain-containing protein [Eubacterium sp.]
MTATKKNTSVKILSLILAIMTVFSAFTVSGSVAQAASKPAQAYVAVQKAYGKSFPLSSKNRVKGKKRVFGVKTSTLSSYYAASKMVGSKTKAEYLIMIAKPAKGTSVKTVKSQLTKYKNNEEASMKNYLSDKGKKLFKNCKVGSTNGYVYIVMIDTNANKKAINAIKKAVK